MKKTLFTLTMVALSVVLVNARLYEKNSESRAIQVITQQEINTYAKMQAPINNYQPAQEFCICASGGYHYSYGNGCIPGVQGCVPNHCPPSPAECL